jgi:hypothetical protein
LDITVNPVQTARPFHIRLGLSLGAAVLVLAALHGFVMTCWSASVCTAMQPAVDNFGYLVDMAREKNIPAWFSAALLLTVAIGAAVLGAVATVGQRGWFWLAILFGYLSLDETTDLHGLWPMMFDLYGVTDGQFQLFLWVVPGAILVAIIGIAFLRWVLALPRRTRVYFLAAGTVFVTGGIGFEVVGALVADATYFTPAYLVAVTLEETLEMLGVVIMLMGLAAHADTIGLRVTAAQS